MSVDRFDCAATPLLPGTTLIDSGAGTGKTYAIATLVPRLLLEGMAGDITRILVVTFTNAAADELAARIRSRLREVLAVLESPSAADQEEALLDDSYLQALRGLGEAKRRLIAAALARIDEIPVYTIHGFCKQALEEAAFESGLPLECEFTENEDALLRRAALDYWRRTIYPDSLLASFIARSGLRPEDFLAEYATFRRYPDCVLLPEAESAASVSTRLRTLSADLRRDWSPAEIRELIAALPTLSGGKDNEMALALKEPERLLASVQQAAEAEDIPWFLETLRPLSVEGVRSALKSAKDKAAFQPGALSLRIEQALQALDGLRHSLRAGFFAEVTRCLEEQKRRQNVMSFHDLLVRFWDVLREPRRGAALAAALRDRYQAALIDEFQDTDPLQLAIFRRIFTGERPLFFIGDPKQAIYSFRGADIHAYLAAAREADRRHTLDKNWRSEDGAVEAVNALFGLRPEPFLFPEIVFPPAVAQGKPPEKSLHDDMRKPCQWLLMPPSDTGKPHTKEIAGRLALQGMLAEMLRLLGGTARIGDRSLRPADLAVLVRTNQQAQGVQRTLRGAGIPAVIGGNGSIFDSEEFAAVALLLRLIARQEGSAALGGMIWGLSAAEMYETTREEERWNALCAQLGEYRRLWENDGAAALLQRVLQDRMTIPRLLAGPGGDRAVTNLRHVLQIVQEGPEAPEALLQWLERRRREPAGDRDELRLETDAQAVQIVTIHKSKGLEYGIVFCPYLWDARSLRGNPPVIAHCSGATGGMGGVVYDCGSPEYDRNRAQAVSEMLSEDLRLLYVALTRAVHRIYLSWGETAAALDGALGWLLQGSGGDLSPVACAQTMVDRYPDLFGAVAQESARDYSAYEDVGQGGGRGERSVPIAPARTFPADRRLRSWDTASFSSLTSIRHPLNALSGEGTVESATPEAAEDGYPDTAVGAGAEDGPDAAGLVSTDVLRGVEGAHEPFFGFGRGPDAPPANETGNCLHEILEVCCRCNAEGTMGRTLWLPDRQLLTQRLADYGLQHPGAHLRLDDPLTATHGMLSRLFNHDLPGSAIRLGRVRECLPEMPFTLPLSGGRLAAALETYFAEDPAYLPLVRCLPQRQLEGYLTGIIDLVFHAGEKWYIIDWKSNWLGDRQEDYRPAALAGAMREHHYILQYLLYTVALRRYLAQREPGFDFARDFGGIYYAFLRGVDGRGGGWYYDLPNARRLQEFEAALFYTPAGQARQ